MEHVHTQARVPARGTSTMDERPCGATASMVGVPLVGTLLNAKL